MSSINEKAMIAKLSFTGIGYHHVDKRISNRVHEELLTQSSYVGNFSKVNLLSTDISKITNIHQAARTYRRHVTSPFGDDESRLLPAVLVYEYTHKMGEFERQHDAVVKQFMDGEWMEIVERQKDRLGPEFDPNAYPAPDKLDSIFKMRWKLIPVADWAEVEHRDHVLFKIEKDIARDIVERARSDERQLLAESTTILWERLFSRVKTLEERLGRERNETKIKQSLFKNIEEECRVVGALNFMDDPEITAIIDDIRQRLLGWLPKQIAKDKRLRQQLVYSCGTICERIIAKLKVGILI